MSITVPQSTESGGDTGRKLHGVVADPHTLTGTTITAVTTAASALAARVHAQARRQENDLELWYYRDSAWHLFPAQPILDAGLHPVLTHAYRQPASLRFSLADVEDGLLTPENQNSSYNLNGASAYDPLLDEARKILLRAGRRCYTNLASGLTPTSTLAPSSGALSSLTNGTLGDVAAGSTNYVQFAPGSASAFDIVIDLGSQQWLRHLVIRFGTKLGTCTLPAVVAFAWSTDNVTYNTLSGDRPVAGNAATPGDWSDSYGGRNVEVARTDIEATARYVRFRITPTGAQTLFVDELAVYGGQASTMYGANLFVGYLGDSIDVDPSGIITCEATDVLRKLQDNNEAPLTAQYTKQDTGDIIRTLLTSSAYWKGTSGAYDAPFASGEVGWSAGADVTAFKWPVWQGQSNNLLGYCFDLLHAIGWEMYADGNGYVQLREPPYRQLMPDRILIAANDGNGDVAHCVRHRTGKDIRNVVEVSSGASSSGGSRTVRIHPTSIARYGRRRARIVDPVAVEQQTRDKICGYILRDWAYRTQSLTSTIRPDHDTHVKGVYGFRAARRPKLYTKDSSIAGSKRTGELWIADMIEHNITKGDWWADCHWVPYNASGPTAPSSVIATPEAFPNTSFIDVSWTASPDTDVQIYRIYYSTSETSFPTTTAETDVTTGPHAVGGLTPGTRYYFYVTAVGANGQESIPSAIVSAVAGGAAGDESKWTVTDLSVAFNQVQSPDDADGYYEYEFLLSFSSPPVVHTGDEGGQYGFKHGEFRFNIGGLPSSPTLQDSWTYQDEWHGPRVPVGKMWDRVTDGQLTWYGRFRSATNLTGQTVHWRMWTWQTTNGRHGPAHPSNTASAAIP
jgi:hypothetical protein